MNPVTISLTSSVATPIERVFALLTDPARIAEWLPRCQAVDTDGPIRKGTRLRVRFAWGETELEITDYSPPAAFGWIERGRRSGCKTFFKLDFSGGSTAITLKDVWIARNLKSWIMGKLFRRRNALRDLDAMIQNLRKMLTR